MKLYKLVYSKDVSLPCDDEREHKLVTKWFGFADELREFISNLHDGDSERIYVDAVNIDTDSPRYLAAWLNNYRPGD